MRTDAAGPIDWPGQGHPGPEGSTANEPAAALPTVRRIGALAGAVYAFAAVSAAAYTAEVFARLHRASLIDEVVSERWDGGDDIFAADDWVLLTDAVGFWTLLVAAVLAAAWFVLARANVAPLGLGRREGSAWKAYGDGRPDRGLLSAAWLVAVGAAITTELSTGPGFSWKAAEALRTSTMEELQPLADADRASIAATCVWPVVGLMTIAVVAVVTKRQQDRERELWIHAATAQAKEDPPMPPTPPAAPPHP